MNAPVALVTGANSGIGLATAGLLASKGWRAFGSVRSGVAERELQTAAPGVVPIVLDVTDAESVESARCRVDAESSGAGLAALVNNAGTVRPGPLETTPLESVRLEFETNALGALRVTQAFLPLLKQAAGRVFFVGSPLAARSRELCGGYAASKAALRSLADTLRLELASAGVGVCCVEANKIATPLWSKAAAELDRIPSKGDYASAIAGARELAAAAGGGRGFAPPEAVARAILHALDAEPLPAEVRAP